MATTPTGTPRSRVQMWGRDTSWDAALLQTPERTAPLYRTIYAVLMQLGPMTDEELLTAVLARMPASPSGCRTRRAELVAAGWVTEARDDAGAVQKRRGTGGTARIVWAAVPPAGGGGLW